MKMVGFAVAVMVLAAVPFEVISFALALFGSLAATVGLVYFRGAVKRFDASVAELAARLPIEED